MGQDYNFWADLLSTFRASNDWIKALIVSAPFATFTACFVAWLRRDRLAPMGEADRPRQDQPPAIEAQAETPLLTAPHRAREKAR